MVKQATAVQQDPSLMLRDFYTLTQKVCDTGDYDPFHPLLREVTKDLPIEEALWFSCLFIAHYNPGSAWIAFHDSDPLKPKKWQLPIETARRALFGGRIYRHLEDLSTQARAVGGLLRFFSRGLGSNRYKNWYIVRRTIGGVYGAGRWAEYTFAEILQKVHDLPLTPPDMGLKNATGPKNGLRLLTGQDTNQAAWRLFGDTYKAVYVPWFDCAVLESVACDFNSLNKGRYYIGRDIDRQQHRILKAEAVLGEELSELWEARSQVFQPKYLGEVNGWQGIDSARCKVYTQTKKIVDR